MLGSKDGNHSASRRSFLRQIRWTPVLFLPAPIQNQLLANPFRGFSVAPDGFSEVRFVPHYPEKSPLDDVLRLATPGSDEYIAEGYAFEITAILREWSEALRKDISAMADVAKFVDPAIQATTMSRPREMQVRAGAGIEVFRREFKLEVVSGLPHFQEEIRTYLSAFKSLEVADFEIFECAVIGEAPARVEASIRYDFVGLRDRDAREARIGVWHTEWASQEAGGWNLLRLSATHESMSRAAGPIFVDVTAAALGGTTSFENQLRHGSDYWRTVLDGAIGVDVYGNNGIAAGDFDNDGFDDLYVCQPAGLPNRLYRNRGDGTFEDVTEKAGVGVLDFTACALFADFENRGLQDLLVVCATGPMLFSNDGNGGFTLKSDAFHFARPPQGSFTHAAVADYDRDGRLDVYFCLYSYYQGLDQYRYPVPYFDARNGPPNYLFHNEGGGVFEDRTEAAGLNAENDRYSFAGSWGDANGDGSPDLYVVNDFGRNVLYRNQGDGTFAATSQESSVDEAGAGMSACWLDFDNDGRQDIYAAGMWVAAGLRVFGDSHFHGKDSQEIRSLYRRHMTGNSLYRNLGNGKFENIGMKAGVEMGRWSWSTDAWDFDHDGYPDLYVANGYVSGAAQRDVSSFFWRQVVANSPPDASPSTAYERGWSAINELIRADATWNGQERNVFYANNRDGTFSDISGLTGLDFRDDSRAFVLADLDGDGRLEIVLKNRTSPQLRILRPALTGIGNSMTLRLRGSTSNRDAIGAAVTVEAGALRQTKYLQAGTGFLSQHAKELSFGLGEARESVKVTIRWPSGLEQTFAKLPANRRIEIHEGSADFVAKPFLARPESWAQPRSITTGEELPSSHATWLVEPVSAPYFSLPDLAGNLRDLGSFRGRRVLLNFWQLDSPASCNQLRALNKSRAALQAKGIDVVALNLDEASALTQVHVFGEKETLGIPVLVAGGEVAGIYNIVFRYLFDRHRDLPLPTSFLVDEPGNIVRVYQGIFTADQLIADLANLPRTPAERVHLALPFPGTLHRDSFQRNAFTYGVAFFQRGFLDQAVRSFQQVVASDPENADAYYNLGTLYLRRHDLQGARQHLEQSVKLRPNYAEAWNNLGMLAAQQGSNDEAIRDFQQSLQLRPDYVTALLNLGNIHRRLGNLDASEALLKRALDREPSNSEVEYNLGMLYARKGDTSHAEESLNAAIKLRPDYADALNNLGVLLVQEQRFTEAEDKFKACILKAPAFDQAYLNLARLHIARNEKEKARAVLQALLQQQPEHKMARQMLQLLY